MFSAFVQYGNSGMFEIGSEAEAHPKLGTTIESSWESPIPSL